MGSHTRYQEAAAVAARCASACTHTSCCCCCCRCMPSIHPARQTDIHLSLPPPCASSSARSSCASVPPPPLAHCPFSAGLRQGFCGTQGRGEGAGGRRTAVALLLLAGLRSLPSRCGRCTKPGAAHPPRLPLLRPSPGNPPAGAPWWRCKTHSGSACPSSLCPCRLRRCRRRRPRCCCWPGCVPAGQQAAPGRRLPAAVQPPQAPPGLPGLQALARGVGAGRAAADQPPAGGAAAGAAAARAAAGCCCCCCCCCCCFHWLLASSALGRIWPQASQMRAEGALTSVHAPHCQLLLASARRAATSAASGGTHLPLPCSREEQQGWRN